MLEFYKPGDCNSKLKPADVQRTNKVHWREQAQIDAWTAVRDDLIEAVNNLWKYEGSYVTFYEDDWFPGYEDLMTDIQKMGYHVYLQTEEAMHSPVQRFVITLDYTGGGERWVEWTRPINSER